MTPNELATLHAMCFDTPRPWNAKEFSDLLSSKQVYLVTANQGFALGRIAGPEVELLAIAVHPDARRQGTGQQLLEEFEIRAKLDNANEVILEVGENNSAAIKLYRKNGYETAGFRKDYYAKPTGEKSSAIVMRRFL
jgi:[ribosomal protein S18]-alanine N-acetyltransferase